MSSTDSSTGSAAAHAGGDSANVVEKTSRSEEETEAIGRRLAEALPPHTVVALCGPLGAGKTVFARGVAAGLGIDPALVTSPTFVYLVDYPEGRIPFVHADLYRFGDVPGELVEGAFESIGLEAALAGDAIVLIEWWPFHRGIEPERIVLVELAVESGDVRSIRLNFRGPGLGAALARVSQ
ncbi:MAG TPA: tRNA (adenosine(37)-N6)-threonylcarbamoyltransferase complex ATPase subunit type 1 TsaE [Candidatus Binatia bacterium]|jgi:tRNA threonylcarbamoyladenosine biosynthesis protein TsaE